MLPVDFLYSAWMRTKDWRPTENGRARSRLRTIPPRNNVARKSGAELDEFTEEDNDHGALEYGALLRKLDKTDTTYRL